VGRLSVSQIDSARFGHERASNRTHETARASRLGLELQLIRVARGGMVAKDSTCPDVEVNLAGPGLTRTEHDLYCLDPK